MSTPAHIESVDTMKNLRTFLCSLAKKISLAIDEADYDILDTFNWLKNDRYPYWKNEVRVRSEQLVKAKLDLKRKQITAQTLNAHDSCIDEIRAFKTAQRRFEEAEDKFAKVKSWMPKLEKASFDCRGGLQALSNYVRIDLPNRRTQIDEMIYALEAYMSVATPVISAGTAASESDSTGRGPAVHVPIEEMGHLCNELRNRIPLPESMQETQLKKLSFEQFNSLVIGSEFLETLENNKHDTALAQSDTIAIDRSIEAADNIYFAHLAAAENDLKWIIGAVVTHNLTDYAVVNACEFGARYPGIATVMSLPPGWLVVANNNQIEYICSADNQVFMRNGR